VNFFEDTGLGVDAEELARNVLDTFHLVCRDTKQELEFEPDTGDPQLSFQLAQIVFDPDFRQQLLTLRSERERLEKLAGYLPFHVKRWKHSESIREKGPRNGHSRHLPVNE
jgi:hypothetical protein